MRWLVVAAALTSALAWAGGRLEEGEPSDPAAEPPPPPPTAALALGRKFSTQLFAGDTGALWAEAGPSMRRQVGGLDGLVTLARKVKGDFGEELRIGSEAVQERGGITVYTRLSIVSLYARGVELQWTWDATGLLLAVSVRPAVTQAPSPYLSTTIKTRLRLPFEGTWNVLWGGRTWEDNPHSSVNDQRFALDLFVWKGSGSFEGDGTKNEQYFCWGRPVVAPAEGRIVFVDEGVYDNLPGRVNPGKLYGNSIVIEHGNGEYSLLGHLMRGSIQVKPGDRVRAGQLLGKAGNSGVSTEPHLHYQLMDAPEWLKAHGMPSVFVDYLADGKPMARGEPRRGQLLSPMTVGR